MTAQVLEQLRADQSRGARGGRARPKSWETAQPSLFLYEYRIRWEQSIPRPVRLRGSLEEEMRHFALGKMVTRSLVQVSPSRRANWARDILAATPALAIQRLVFDTDSLVQEALLFHLPEDTVAVFYRFEDGRVLTCAIRNFRDDPQNFYALAKILGHDPLYRPTRKSVKSATCIVHMLIDFLGPAEGDLNLLGDAESIRVQFYAPVAELFRRWLKPYGSPHSPSIAAACQRLWRYYLRDALIAMRRFLAPLDPDALAVARPNTVNGALAYQYYAMAEPRVRLYRQQAAKSFPILAGLLPHWQGAADDVLRVRNSASRRWHLLRLGIGTVDYPSRLDAVRAVDPEAARLGEITETIDEAKSLNAALAKALGLSPATIKSLRSGGFGYPRLEKFEEFCTLLECIPVNLRPRRGEDFRTLDAIVDKMKALLSQKILSTDLAASFYARQIGVIKRWLQPVAKDAHRRGWEAAFAAIDINIGDYEDFLQALAEWIACLNQPGEAHGRHKRIVILDIFERESVRRIAKLSVDWHEAILHCRREVAARLRVPKARQRRHSIMPIIIRRPCKIDGLAVVPLLSPLEFDAEGLAMRHCVGGYSHQARCLRSAIFSIRTLDGSRLSTLELRPGIVSLINDGNHRRSVEFSLGQHKGPQNSIPSRREQSVVRQFLREANRFRWDFTEEGSITRLRRAKIRREPELHVDVERQITREANAMALARLLPDLIK